jgi:CubicO group peptidase (beta-lactamase class C family)
LTATLVGTYVAEGSLKWTTPITSFFPELAAQIPGANRAITIGDVLSHSAGLRRDLDWYALGRQGTIAQQRQAAARQSLLAPEFPPGSFHYANADYVVIAALLERMTGQSWEKLMAERIFQPLHMDSAGFYRAACREQVDQPWPHHADGLPVSPTDFTATSLALGQDELPHLLAPAGLIHCSMADWAKFLSDQLRGAAGLPALLPKSVYRAMQTARLGSPAGYGWGVSEQAWAGKILTHEGSDGLNDSICLLAPAKKFGVLVCTNQGGDAAHRACNEAVTLLVNRYLSRASAPTNER